MVEIEAYKNKCMRDATKQMAGVLVYAMKNMMKQLCKKGSKQIIRLMGASPCVNSGNGEVIFYDAGAEYIISP